MYLFNRHFNCNREVELLIWSDLLQHNKTTTTYCIFKTKREKKARNKSYPSMLAFQKGK